MEADMLILDVAILENCSSVLHADLVNKSIFLQSNLQISMYSQHYLQMTVFAQMLHHSSQVTFCWKKMTLIRHKGEEGTSDYQP